MRPQRGDPGVSPELLQHCPLRRARGKGRERERWTALKDGTKLTVYFRKPPIQKSGPAYEQVWRKLVQPEIKRAEDLEELPLLLD
jgi:hypothetical protein